MAESDKSENRLRTGKRMAPWTAFQPGMSGNPGGRPKRTQQEYDLMKACAFKTPEALDTILMLMDSAKDSVRLQAAVFIIERAYGKTLEKHAQHHNPLEDETTAMLLEMKSEIQERQQLKLVRQQAGPNEKEPSR